MFFPEHLLSKSGPLARVWLAANLEKRLSKNQILQDKIGDDIAVITRPDVAGGPMALRLSGQLLLGVVRIYSRKARYLLEDCNDALSHIKLMAFRKGDIDLGPNQSHIANPATLTLPDVATELDLLAPMPDPFLLESSQPLDLNLALNDSIVQDWDSSQFLTGSIEQQGLEMRAFDDEDLDLDLGEDLDIDEGTSIERGRDAPLERRMSEEFGSSKVFEDDDLGIDIGEDDDTILPPAPGDDLDDAMDVDMGGMTELEPLAEPTENRERSMSPLSDIDPEQAKELEQTFTENQTAFEPEQEEEGETVHQAQRVKRRKVLQSDVETQIPNNQIREQLNDRSKILKPASFLPRDPTLAALQSLQRSGGFISSILGDGRNRGWAPELRGILSLELVSRPGQKRKRDSGVADLDTEEEAGGEKTPQLEFEQTEEDVQDVADPIGGDTSLRFGDDEIIQLPGDDDAAQEFEEPLEDEPFSPVADNFDDTTAPLLHPADGGPVSLGTKHAIHLLRDTLGSDSGASESERQKKSVLFQDMLPESTTTKAEATKMFFEVLVLATKDAIKVEQPINDIGGPLRIRAKRALWDWKESPANDDAAAQEETAAVAVEA